MPFSSLGWQIFYALGAVAVRSSLRRQTGRQVSRASAGGASRNAQIQVRAYFKRTILMATKRKTGNHAPIKGVMYWNFARSIVIIWLT